MGTIKNFVKKVMFAISPVYRHTTYLLSMQQEITRLQQETRDMQHETRDLQYEIRDMQQSMRIQLDEYLKPLQQETRDMQHETRDLQYEIRDMQRSMRIQLDEYLKPQSERFTNHYEYWRAKRIVTIVEHYGEAWFKGKRILELGCGYGDIGHVLMTIGAEVIFAEGREENCDYLRRRFPNNKVYCMNCENEWPFSEDMQFDMVLHMGLLYHLDNLWFALDKACACCDQLVLETEVSDSDNEDYILKIDESADGWDQSLIGHGSRPSGPCVEKHLREIGWSCQRMTDARCNALFHTYDWEVKNTGTWRNGLRRFWFCKKEEN